MFAVQSRPSIDILRTLEPSDVVIYPSVITQTEFVRALKDFPVLYDDIEGRCGHCPTSKAAIRELSRRLGLSGKYLFAFLKNSSILWEHKTYQMIIVFYELVKACYDRLYRIRNRKSPYDPLWHILMDRRSTIPSDEDFLAIVKSKLDGLLPSNRNKLKSFFLSKLAEF